MRVYAESMDQCQPYADPRSMSGGQGHGTFRRCLDGTFLLGIVCTVSYGEVTLDVGK
jgi:hypothetical protein